MERKTWVMPMTLVQKFEANETIASTCWKVACSSTAEYNHNDKPPFNTDGMWDGNESTNVIGWGHGGGCQNAANNVFRVEDDGSVTFVSELGGGDVTGGGYQNYIDMNGDNKISKGDYFTWYTERDRWYQIYLRWNHWGVVEDVDPKHPNRS